MKFLIRFFNIIISKIKGTSNSDASSGNVVPVNPKAKTIFLVVGHSAVDGGMEIYKNDRYKSEYSFNQDVAIACKSYINKEKINIFIGYRQNSVNYTSAMRSLARDAKDIGADLAIELHLNASGIPEARGFEILTNKMSEKIARVIADGFIERYSIRARGDNGVKVLNSSDRGAGFLSAMSDVGVPSMLIEPCFADYRTSESVQIIEDHQGYGDFLAKTLEQFA